LAVKGRVFAFCPTREEIAVAEADGTVRVWNLVTGRPVWATPPGLKAVVSRLAYSPDGRRVAAAGVGAGLRVWEADGGRGGWRAGLRVWEGGGGAEGGRAVGSCGAGGEGGGGGGAAAVGVGLGVWEADGGREVWKAGGGYFGVAFSPDGRRVAAAEVGQG